MQNINEYLFELNNQLNNLVVEYDKIQNKIREEKFAFELKRKNFIEVVGAELSRDLHKDAEFQQLRLVNMNLNEKDIDNCIKDILNI